MKKFDRITSSECREFLADRLSDDALLGKSGYLFRQNSYLLPYEPEQEADAKDLINALTNTDLPNKGVKAANINLYDIVLAYLDEQSMWEPLCEAEAESTREEIIMMLQDTVSVSDVITPRVQEVIETSECDLAFITGVGETYPYVRTHVLLTELLNDKPIVLVFPGEYRVLADGSTSLDILGIPSETNGGYYRATNVFDL